MMGLRTMRFRFKMEEWPQRSRKHTMKTDTTTNGPEVGTRALVAVLGDVQAARLTADKTATVVRRDGYQITGFVLCHPETGNRCIIEMSACRWLTNEESWWLMHVSNELPPAANAQGDPPR